MVFWTKPINSGGQDSTPPDILFIQDFMNGFIKKTVIFITVMLAVGLVGWSGRKVYQRTTERHLVAEARSFLEKKDLRNASLCLQRAIQINSVDPETCSLSADLLEAEGLPAALNWRIRAVQTQTNNVDYRLAWAETALLMNELPSAVQALRGVDEKGRTTAAYHKLAGTLAWDYHGAADAEKEFSAALKLEPTNQVVLVNLAMVHLVSTNQAVVGSARDFLEKVPSNSPLYLTAVRNLAADAVMHQSLDRALYYSREVVADTNSSFSDRLAHLKLLRETGDAEYGEWKRSVDKEALGTPDKVLTLAHLMQAQDGPEKTLAWLRGLPPTLQTNQPVPLAITDCQIALKDWNGLLAITDRQEWGELNYYRLALGALASRNLGDNRRSDAQWQKTFQLSSHRLDRLARLNQVTSAWQWSTERKQVLDCIIAQFPKETWAGDQLVAMLYSDGKTRALAEVLDKMNAANPTDAHLKNVLASVLLLLKSDMDKAHRLASESYGVSPNDPFVDCVYGYSLILQSKPTEAVKVMDQINAEYLKNPSVAAYYGVIEALAGHKEAARVPLKLAERAHLLPEEMDLVRRTESQL
jgi:predicted Zn-dependent protease